MRLIKLFWPPLQGALNLVNMKKAITFFLEVRYPAFPKDRVVPDLNG